jgi:hypothetical protein
VPLGAGGPMRSGEDPVARPMAAKSTSARAAAAVAGQDGRGCHSVQLVVFGKRQGPPPARSPLTATALAPAPTWLAAQLSTGSIDIDRHGVGAI